MCGFVQDNNDTFDWTRYRGSTPSSSTGPTADHTTGSYYGMNYFIFFYYYFFITFLAIAIEYSELKTHIMVPTVFSVL